ncbi:MAG: nickel transporter subunit [Chloroflexi bacterium]|nr:MAG: nickel transporter subunit [Chloroflexota bacterium]
MLPAARQRNLLAHIWGHSQAKVGLIIGGLLLCFVVIGPLVYRVDPTQQDYSMKLSPPNAAHILGTDQSGRDQLARLMEGGSRSLGAALLVLILVSSIGLVIGLIAGMSGGWFDALAMRLVDVMMALPGMVMAIAVVGVLGPSFVNLLVALVVSSWAYYARLSRSYVLTARQRQDVISARLAGIGWGRIVLTHILPGVLTQLIVIVTLNLGSMISWISGLSFLGLGVQPPDAEWGAMLSGSRLYFTMAPWLLIAPAILIFLSVISANLLGNALRDIWDPKTNG